MTSSSYSHVGGVGTPQAELSKLPDPRDQEGTSSRILTAVGKGTLYAVGVLSPVVLAGTLVIATYILGQEAVFWTVAASTGNWEKYRKEKRKRWSMKGVGCGTGRMNAQRNAQRRAEERAAAAETYRKEHGMSAKS
ncbi:hypothetical protein DL96DRAFT_1715557 [Flagelloscypha sp. PMI_526]|nr:hypothetical protein DL96DRAFT_1715557 [Flagelloscypha sp. PMI_526]